MVPPARLLRGQQTAAGMRGTLFTGRPQCPLVGGGPAAGRGGCASRSLATRTRSARLLCERGRASKGAPNPRASQALRRQEASREILSFNGENAASVNPLKKR